MPVQHLPGLPLPSCNRYLQYDVRDLPHTPYRTSTTYVLQAFVPVYIQ